MKVGKGDALLVVDIQHDFLEGGGLAMDRADEVIPILNDCIAHFLENELHIYACRDWHPVDHCSFRENGGPWPPHCIAGTHGAEFSELLELPPGTPVFSKGTDREREAYSAFDGTELHAALKRDGITRIFMGGLTTEYCVLNSVLDAAKLGLQAVVLLDATKAVNLNPGDGQAALEKMSAAGAAMIVSENLR